MNAGSPLVLANVVYNSLYPMPRPLTDIVIQYAKSINIFEKHQALIQEMNDLKPDSILSEESINQIKILFNDIIEEEVDAETFSLETLVSIPSLRAFLTQKWKIQEMSHLPKGYIARMRRIRVVALVNSALTTHTLTAGLNGLGIPESNLLTHSQFLCFALRKTLVFSRNLQMEYVDIKEISEQNLAWLGEIRESSGVKLLGCRLNTVIDQGSFPKFSIP